MGNFRFEISNHSINIAAVRSALEDPSCGAYVQFDGWVRNVNEGRDVVRLEYEVHEPLAVREGEKILREAAERFDIKRAVAIHRAGLLELGEMAVVVATVAPHRDAAFLACRYIIDEIKVRLPIWKKEHYADGESEWINCQLPGS